MSFIVYSDNRIFVCIKPNGILSTDEPGGMPELIREQLGDSKACVRTVHRLDRVVAGLMVFARSAKASQILSDEIQQHQFTKEYVAVVHGVPSKSQGTFEDLLIRSKTDRKTYVTQTPGKGVQPAKLSYKVLQTIQDKTLVKIKLFTGRTHQIRCQFSSHGLALLGDKKYGVPDECENIALWSYHLAFNHPQTGDLMDFTAPPPETYPWTLFNKEAFTG